MLTHLLGFLLRLVLPLAMIPAAVLGAAYAGFFDAHGPLEGSALVGPGSLTARLPFVDAGVPSVEEATEALVDAAVSPAGIEGWAFALSGLAGDGTDGGDLISAANRAQVAAALRDSATVEALQRQAEALAGSEFGSRAARDAASGGETGSAGTGADAEVGAYFVNGILNTAQDAEAGRVALQQLFEVPVTGYYNHSSRETAGLQADFCRRALGLERQGVELSAWGSVTALCRGVEGVTEIASAALEGFRGAVEVSAMRIFGVGSFFEADTAADVASSAVNDELTEDVRHAVEAGTPLVLVGHSQGTMFAGNAFRQAGDWWDGLVEAGRACGPNPIAVLYISPAFTPRTTINQHYVEVAGDILAVTGVTSVPATAQPTGGQQGLGALDLHGLNTYLLKGTETRAQVESKFGLAADYARLHGGVTVAPEGGTLPGAVVGVTGDGLFVAPGGESRFTLRLPCRPEAPVTIHLNRMAQSSGGEGLTPSPSTLEFTTANWNRPREVTVTAPGDATPGLTLFAAATTSDDAFYDAAPPAVVRVVVSGEAAPAPAGDHLHAEGAADLEAPMREGMAGAFDQMLEQVPDEAAAQLRAQIPALIDQALASFSASENAVILDFPPEGGPVTGAVTWDVTFTAPAMPGTPGAGACIVRTVTTGTLTGTFDAGTGTFEGVGTTEGDVTTTGCEGLAPLMPSITSGDLRWTATLEGDRITGELTGTAPGTVATPFQANVE